MEKLNSISRNNSDEELMKAIKNGNSYAFELLYNRYKPLIISYICRMIQNYQKAEDLTHDVFLKILAKRNLYKYPKKFSSWIYKIATNVCIDEIRHSKFQVKIDEKKIQQISQETSSEPGEDIEIKEKENIVKAAINGLSNEHKTLIILQHYQNLQYEEIAEVLNKDFNWVKWHIKLAYDELEEKLKPYL